MAGQAQKNLSEVAREVGRYSPDAFAFLHEALDYTVRKVHGEHSDVVPALMRWLEQNGVEPADIDALIDAGELPDQIEQIIDQLGGAESLVHRVNRHIGGDELCWGLRDLALERWGFMAGAVLSHWGIRKTEDIGQMVFALVENEMLQKEPTDRLADFENVFDFETAFDQSYKSKLEDKGKQGAAEAEEDEAA